MLPRWLWWFAEPKYLLGLGVMGSIPKMQPWGVTPLIPLGNWQVAQLKPTPKRGYQIPVLNPQTYSSPSNAEDEDDDDEVEQIEQSKPQVQGIYCSKDTMLSSIKEFFQEHGYVIFSRHLEKDKRNIFKCDRYIFIFFSFLISLLIAIIECRKKEDNKIKGKPHDQSKFSRLIAYVENPSTPSQYTKVKNLTQAGLKSAKILQVMQTTKETTENLLATKNKIYAAKQRVKTESL
ncbi:putative signal peptide protein [Puccinia sorghi]|uniref:Putative signal peptide protein n=1 Tax=Puccinia sorghi TaxID=27349 RepID=A0A0L6U5T1_9BASI|nr:putative signal peptide protein [Puccinia sorghi]